MQSNLAWWREQNTDTIYIADNARRLNYCLQSVTTVAAAATTTTTTATATTTTAAATTTITTFNARFRKLMSLCKVELE